MSKGGTIALAAGGTGGHMFPAFAVAKVLVTLGYQPLLLTDKRGQRYVPLYESGEAFEIASSTLKGKSLKSFWNLFSQNLKGIVQARRYLKQSQAVALVGFGGYPSLPSVLAAWTLGLPIILQEQNAVLGRANAFLARFAKAVAFAMEKVKGAEAIDQSKRHFTGLPLRLGVTSLAKAPYPDLSTNDPIHLLVFGGSQGARILTDLVPKALSGLPDLIKKRLCVIQQCPEADQDLLMKTYQDEAIDAKVSPLFANLPELMAQSHIVIARAGASTVCELGTIGRPAILIPLAASLDQDQTHNAAELAKTGGTLIFQEKSLTVDALRSALYEWLESPDELKMKAEMQTRFSHANAAENVAELTLKLLK